MFSCLIVHKMATITYLSNTKVAFWRGDTDGRHCRSDVDAVVAGAVKAVSRLRKFSEQFSKPNKYYF